MTKTNKNDKVLVNVILGTDKPLVMEGVSVFDEAVADAVCNRVSDATGTRVDLLLMAPNPLCPSVFCGMTEGGFAVIVPWIMRNADVDTLVAMTVAALNGASEAPPEVDAYIRSDFEDCDEIMRLYGAVRADEGVIPRITAEARVMETTIHFSHKRMYLLPEDSVLLFDDCGQVPAVAFHPSLEGAPDDVVAYVVALRWMNSETLDDDVRDEYLRTRFGQVAILKAESWIGEHGLKAPYEML